MSPRLQKILVSSSLLLFSSSDDTSSWDASSSLELESDAVE